MLIPRVIESARLAAFLRPAAVDRALVVVGPNGVGKTTLVREAARAIEAQSPSTRVMHYETGDDDTHFEGRLVSFEHRALASLGSVGAHKIDAWRVLGGLFAREASVALPDYVRQLEDTAGVKARMTVFDKGARDRLVRSTASLPLADAWKELISQGKGTMVSTSDGVPVQLSPSVALAYDLLVAYETWISHGQRTGRVLLPFFLSLLTHVAETTEHKFKLIFSLSEKLHNGRARRDSDLIDVLMLHFTEFNTKFRSVIPTIIDSSHPYFAHGLGQDFLLPVCRMVPHSEDFTARFEFLEVSRIEKPQAQALLVPDHVTESEFQRVYAAVSGQMSHIAALLSQRPKGGEVSDDDVKTFLNAHCNNLAHRLDQCIAKCSFDGDATESTPEPSLAILFRFMDMIERVLEAKEARLINVGDDVGVEALHQPVMQILLRQGFLLQLLSPPFILPCSLADAYALKQWLQAKKASLSTWQTAKYSAFKFFRGVGSLKHLHYHTLPILQPAPPEV